MEAIDVDQVLRNMAADESSRTEAIQRENQLQKLQDAVDKLSQEQKRCIELFYMEQKSYKEVSDLTGFSVNEVKSYLQNGKRNLKGYLVTVENA
jgi:RNA polymerase sigma-70 factor (ECF subfamily)